MRALVTSSRLPAALEEIRKLGRAGHVVYASDTFGSSPGNRSNQVTERFVTASPTFAPAAFIDDVEEIVREHPIDLVMPSFEEVFVLAKYRDRIERHSSLFAPSFEVLQTLHDKRLFTALARELGLTVPETLVAESEVELRDAIAQIPRVFGPDETLSNGLGALFETTDRQWNAPILPTDEFLAPTGRVMDAMLSEHQCEGWLEGYLLTGRHGVFNWYEAFIHIVDSMFDQHAKWLKVSAQLPWRHKIASLNYLLTSHVWRQDLIDRRSTRSSPRTGRSSSPSTRIRG